MAKTILITGANGEVGHGLIRTLGEQDHTLLALDMHPMDTTLFPYLHRHWVGNILDEKLITQIFDEYSIDVVFHMAAMLSTSAEHRPTLAHQVNVQGTLSLLEAAQSHAEKHRKKIIFLFPISIAVYGLPNIETKTRVGAIDEEQFLHPITIYGITKLHCEELGRYYTYHYKQLDTTSHAQYVDFRSLRFPGLISADTVPSGGTSDYGPEMLHAAAQNQPYAAFVRPDTTIPFMAMPDAVKALIMLAQAPNEALTRTVYNVTSFSLSAEQIATTTQKFFPTAQIEYKPHSGRQQIVDSWPALIDDQAARRDWGWLPDYDAERAFDDYLIPAIKRHYQVGQNA